MSEQSGFKGLEVVELNISKGEYLSEALKRQGYPCLPSNAIINKVMTGTGATYMELETKITPRNSIVIEPYRSAVDDKVSIFKDSFGVFKEATPKQLGTYLRRKDIKYKKIITTPEGFMKKVLPVAVKLGINLHEEFFCLYDEEEHVTLDTGYRRSISAPMAEFFKFKNKALVSATPIKPSKYTINLFLRNKFKWVEIKPDYPYQEDMTLITTRSFHKRVREKVKELLDAGSPHVCLFYKTTEGLRIIIEDLIENGIIDDSEYKVFCSKESADKLKGKLLERSSDKLELPLGRVTAFTSRFFPSIDIKIDKSCDVLILSNYDHVHHSLIDPHTEAIQCQGRFRNVFHNGKRYNSLTVVSSIPADLEIKSPVEIDNDLWSRIRSYRAVKLKMGTLSKPEDVKYYDKELKNMRLNEIMNSSRDQIDRFAIEQMLEEERIKSYYLSPEALKAAYEDTNYFNIKFEPDNEPVGEDDIYKLQAASAQRRFKLIVNALERIGSDTDALRLLRANCVQEEWLIEAFLKLGRSVLEESEFHKSKINELLQAVKVQEGNQKRFSPEFIAHIHSEFSEEVQQETYRPREVVLDKLARLYDVYGITYARYGTGKSSKQVACKLSAETLDDYFDFTISNRSGAKVKLTGFKERPVQNSQSPIPE